MKSQAMLLGVKLVGAFGRGYREGYNFAKSGMKSAEDR